MLTGALPPDKGTIKRADGLRVITFDQHREQLDLKLTLRRALCESGEFVHYKGAPIHVMAWAERFLFSKEQLDVPLSWLSGGEQARVLIARLMLRPADVLLLDEPTNDLDINSLEVLEASMLDFSGALVLVTHDRYLLDRVSQELLALDGKGSARYYADLAQWEDLQGEVSAPEPEPAPLAAVTANPDATKFSQKDAKELRQIEAQIRAAETELADARTALTDPAIATNAAELVLRQEALDAAERGLHDLMKRWEQLEARK